MGIAFESRADDGAGRDGGGRSLVWDIPVRLVHWLMVLSFAGAYVTAESEHWRLVHVSLGYTLAGLVAFRLLWGVIGTRHARFASFVRGPRAVRRYLRSLATATPEHHAGHNPAGALAIVALLGLAAVVTATGFGTYNELAGEWLGEVHESVANIMLALVGIHVAGVLLASWLHRENLVAAMVSGRRRVAPAEGIGRPWRSVAILVLAGVLGFWWMQLDTAPAGGTTAAGTTASAIVRHGDRHHD